MDRESYGPDLPPQARATRMKRIRQVSALMSHACLAVAAALILALTAYWWTAPAEDLLRHVGVPSASPSDLPMSLRFATFAIAVIPLAALVYGLVAARRCFSACAAGRVFSREATGGLRAFAFAVALSALLKPLAGAALSLAFSAAGSSRQHSLVLAVGSDTLLSLLFAGMVALIAWIISEASEIADENQQFV